MEATDAGCWSRYCRQRWRAAPIVSNHKPVLRNVDDAARRRFNIVPFTNKPASPDRELEQKLTAEWPAILRWMIDGCLMWQRDGLRRPKVVTANLSETAGALFKSWSEYATANGEKPGAAKCRLQCGHALSDAGCVASETLL